MNVQEKRMMIGSYGVITELYCYVAYTLLMISNQIKSNIIYSHVQTISQCI